MVNGDIRWVEWLRENERGERTWIRSLLLTKTNICRLKKLLIKGFFFFFRLLKISILWLAFKGSSATSTAYQVYFPFKDHTYPFNIHALPNQTYKWWKAMKWPYLPIMQQIKSQESMECMRKNPASFPWYPSTWVGIHHPKMEQQQHKGHLFGQLHLPCPTCLVVLVLCYQSFHMLLLPIIPLKFLKPIRPTTKWRLRSADFMVLLMEIRTKMQGGILDK